MRLSLEAGAAPLPNEPQSVMDISVSLSFTTSHHLLPHPCAQRRPHVLQHHPASRMRLQVPAQVLPRPRLMKPRCGGSPSTGLNLGARRHSAASSHWEGPLAVSDELTQQKSTFQAYATRCRIHEADSLGSTPSSSLMKTSVVPQLLTHIQGVDPRTRRASHAMYAWRVRPTHAAPTTPEALPNMVLFGSSNGGEAGAGERLERLLELGGCEDVVLVVFRWYGGTKLGSDRWRCISSVAKQALDRGSFLRSASPGEDGQTGGGGKNRKRGR